SVSHHNRETTGLHSHERDGTELFQTVPKPRMVSQVTVHPRTTEQGSRSGTSEPRRSESGGAALLHPQELESLLLNIDASLRVHSRHQLFGWTQGMRQSLIKHELLVCAVRGARPTHCAHQQLVLDQALEHSLSPAKQLMTRMHPERCVDVEQQRLELLRVQ